ncbi:putative LRR containing protein, partial [Trachipleistophora hominis]
MCKTVLDEQDGNLLTKTDIDLRNYIHKLQLGNLSSDKPMAQNGMVNIDITSMFQTGLFENIMFRKLILRLCNAYFNISSLSLPAHELVLHCNDSTIEVKNKLPSILTALYIQNSYLEGVLESNHRLRVIRLYNIAAEHKLAVFVNEQYTTIEITNVAGQVSIPFVNKYREIFQIKNWKKFILRKNIAGTIHELNICNAKFIKNWKMYEEIKKLQLENVTCASNSTITISRDSLCLSILNCKCGVSLAESKFIEKLELANCKKIVEMIAYQGGMLRALRLIENRSDTHIFLNEGIEEIYVSDSVSAIQYVRHLITPRICSRATLYYWR